MISVTVVEKMKIEERIRWNWKFIFKQIAGEFSISVEYEIQNAVDTSLQAEQNTWSSTHNLEVVEVPGKLYGGRLDYPRCISKVLLQALLFLSSQNTYLSTHIGEDVLVLLWISVCPSIHPQHFNPGGIFR